MLWVGFEPGVAGWPGQAQTNPLSYCGQAGRKFNFYEKLKLESHHRNSGETLVYTP